MPRYVIAEQGKFAGQKVPVSEFAAEVRKANPNVADFTDDDIADTMASAFPGMYRIVDEDAAPKPLQQEGFSLQRMLSSAPGSLGRAAVNTVLAPAYLVGLAGMAGAATLQSGAKAVGADLGPTIPTLGEMFENLGEGVRNFLNERYGSKENFLRTLENDPFGVLQDVAAVAGVASGVGRGLASGAAKGFAKAGKPLVAMKAEDLAGRLGSLEYGAGWLDPSIAAGRGIYRAASGPISEMATAKLRSLLSYSQDTPLDVQERQIRTLIEHEIPIGKSGIEKIDSMVQENTDILKAAIDAAEQQGVTVDLTKPIKRVRELWDAQGGANVNQKLREIYAFMAAPDARQGAGVVNKLGGAVRLYRVYDPQTKETIGPFVSEEAALKYVKANPQLSGAQIRYEGVKSFYPQYQNVMEELSANVPHKPPSDVLEPWIQKPQLFVYLDETGKINAIPDYSPRPLSIKEADLFRRAENADYAMDKAYEQNTKGAVGSELVKARIEFDKGLREAIYESLENAGLGAADAWRDFGMRNKELIDLRDKIQQAVTRAANENPMGNTSPYYIASAAVTLSSLLTGRALATLPTVVTIMGYLKWYFRRDPEALSKVLYGLMRNNPDTMFWKKVYHGILTGKVIGSAKEDSIMADTVYLPSRDITLRVVREPEQSKQGQQEGQRKSDVGVDPFGGAKK